jgi:hypothetical protein
VSKYCIYLGSVRIITMIILLIYGMPHHCESMTTTRTSIHRRLRISRWDQVLPQH